MGIATHATLKILGKLGVAKRIDFRDLFMTQASNHVGIRGQLSLETHLGSFSLLIDTISRVKLLVEAPGVLCG